MAGQNNSSSINNLGPQQATEIVYVCSPDWEHYLFTSLRSLLASGTSFDRIVIFCVGKRPKLWNFEDSRILVKEVVSLTGNYFLSNKTYLCTRQADRIIFLDTDTIVMKSIDTVWQGVNSDFLGRTATGYQDKNWNHQSWVKKLQHVGATDTPYFNSGFVIFQNGAHRQIQDLWLEFTKRNLAGEFTKTTRLAEQYGLSLAIGAAKLSYHLLNNTEHGYGWENEPYEDKAVYHTGSPGFLDTATYLEHSLGIAELNLPILKDVSKFNRIWFHRKLRHTRWELKNKLKEGMPWVVRLLQNKRERAQ